jgi:hypothetical protein
MKVERFTEEVSTGKKSSEIRFFVTSLFRPAPQLMEISIQHWKIETMHRASSTTWKATLKTSLKSPGAMRLRFYPFFGSWPSIL